MPWTYGIQEPVPGDGSPGPYSSDPGDTSGFIWEEPAELANGNVRLRVIAGATAEAWAGCSVYGSPDGGSYTKIFQTQHRSIIGHTNNILAAGATDWQPAGTVDVHLVDSPGQLISTDLSSLFAGANRCLIGNEVLSFLTATLIAANTYRLTGVYRAWYDTEREAHAAGSRFALLDFGQESFDLPRETINAVWWYKLASINLGGVEQSLAAVGANWMELLGRGLHTEFQRGRARQFIAGEAINWAQHCYLNDVDGRVYLSTSLTPLPLGLAQSPDLGGWPVVAGEKVYVQVDGLMEDPGGAATPPGAWAWTMGDYLYRSATPGVMTNVPDGNPTVALALTATEILIFAPRPQHTLASLQLIDTGTAYELRIVSDSNPDFTADRTLTLNLANADRTLTISGNATVSQDYSATGVVQFSTLTLDNTGLHLLDTNASHDLIIKPGSDLTADRILTITTGDAARTVTLSGNPTLDDWFDQAVKAASGPTFSTLLVNGWLYLGGGQTDFPAVDAGVCRIFRTAATGGAYPFTQAGHLVYQSRDTGATRAHIFATGNPSVIRWEVSGAGHWLPEADATYNIGAVGAQVAWGYFVQATFNAGAAVLGGITLNGTNYPCLTMQNAGVTKAYMAVVTAAGGFFTGAAISDLAIRNNANSLLLGANNGTARAQIEIGQSITLLNKPYAFTPGATQAIAAAGNAITATTEVYKKISNTTGGSITLTSTPTIADGTTGQLLILVNVGADNVVIQDQGTLAGSNLELSAASVTIGQHDYIMLIFDGSDWRQLTALCAT